MKKLLSCFIAATLLSASIFAKNYQINNVEYTLNSSSWKFLPTTSQDQLEKNVPVDQKRQFQSIEDLENYIADYKQQLNNTRIFDSVEINYSVTESEELNLVTLQVETTDTVSLLAVPYPNYNSNTGFVFKIKAKDYNFLGTMETMSADLSLGVDNEKNFSVGLNFNYDYPFKAGIFDMTWLNDYGISYTIGEDMPEWNTKTGFLVSIPKDRIAFQLKATESFNNNLSYSAYDDNMYFNTNVTFQTPIKVGEIDHFGKITTTPYIAFDVNYDFDGINPNNAGLSSPSISAGNTIGGSRINWSNNFRTGLSCSFNADVEYNSQRELWYPSVSLEVQGFKGFTFTENFNWFNRMGIASNLYIFYCFNDRDNPYAYSDGHSIGSRLRGIKDSQGFEGYSGLGSATKTPAAIVFNFDLPWHIFSTNFTKSFLKHLNFDLQISPFFDMALTYNKATGKYFDLKDGFYGAGLEVLVYPKKWSSFTVRGSIGFDVGRKVFGSLLNTDWRQNVSAYEISIGIGLHY